MAGRKSTFAFDLSKPLKKGTLLKQGALHKAFKHREFVIYPGFMVYYENESKWRLDLTKGETLGGRLGAVKLKKATVSIARGAPKACKHGLVVHAPDPANKRMSYLLNASSKEERDQWIEAIRNAIPVSPQLKRKDIGQTDAKTEPRKAPEKAPLGNGDVKSDHPAHPSYTARQDTACDAAIAAASCTDTQKEQEAVDEVTTSVTNSLKDSAGFLTRHDTATMAAISLSTSPEENGLLAEIRDELETNIDLILGKPEEQPHSSEEDSGSCVSTTPEPVTVTPEPVTVTPEPTTSSSEPATTGTSSEPALSEPASSEPATTSPKPATPEPVTATSPEPEPATPTTPEPVTPDFMSPEPEDATEMETTETVRNGDVADGETTVTTTVTVACASNSQESAENSPLLDRKDTHEKTPTPEEGAEETNGPEENGETRGRSCSSTQVLVNDTDEHVTLSVNLNNYDSDNTLSDEESHTELPQRKTSDSEKSPSPPITIKEDRTGISPKANGEAKANGESSANGEAKANGEASTNGEGRKDSANGDTETLTPPANQRRRSSTPFVEKKGFLYKMGGQRKSWKLRYFVLRPGVFNYFKDGSSHKAIGEVKLKNLSIFFPGIGERKQSFQFTVHTESSWNKRANYVFAAQSEREMKEWIAAFRLAGQKSGSSPAPESD